MVDKLVTQSDAILARLDRRFGFSADYLVAGEITVDPVIGTQTPSFTTIPDIRLRSRVLSTRELIEITETGLLQVETAWKMRRHFVSETKPDDRFTLTVSGLQFLVLRVQLDDLQLDWTLLTRRLR